MLDTKRMCSFRLNERTIRQLERWAIQLNTTKTQVLTELVDELSQFVFEEKDHRLQLKHRPTGQYLHLFRGQYERESK